MKPDGGGIITKLRRSCQRTWLSSYPERFLTRRGASPFPQATVFRQSRDLNGCMVLISMSKKGQRGLDMHVRSYVPATQETFR